MNAHRPQFNSHQHFTSLVSSIPFLILNPHLKVYLLVLERGGKIEININVREKRPLVASIRIPNLQPRYVP